MLLNLDHELFIVALLKNWVVGFCVFWDFCVCFLVVRCLFFGGFFVVWGVSLGGSHPTSITALVVGAPFTVRAAQPGRCAPCKLGGNCCVLLRRLFYWWKDMVWRWLQNYFSGTWISAPSAAFQFTFPSILLLFFVRFKSRFVGPFSGIAAGMFCELCCFFAVWDLFGGLYCSDGGRNPLRSRGGTLFKL